MKKSIRIAAALCAAVFALPVLAGCDFTNGDKSKDGDNSTVSGNGGAGENPFKGKTIERDWTHKDLYYRNALTFTTDTKGIWIMECRAIDAVSRDGPHYEEVPFTYALIKNGKNFLRVSYEIETYYNDAGEECAFDEFVEELYSGILQETKALWREAVEIEYWYYEFTDNNTVRINEHYYAGDMKKSNIRFDLGRHDGDVLIDFARDELYLRCYKYNNEDVRRRYWGVPQFSNNAFTVTMYREDETENGDETYVEIGSLAGTYAIEGTGSKCDGTITFTQFPDEMKGLFAVSYQIQSYDSQDDDEEHAWDEYRIVTK